MIEPNLTTMELPPHVAELTLQRELRAYEIRVRRDEIARLLVECWQLWCPSAALNEAERARLQARVYELVASTEPGLEDRALLSARRSLDDLLGEAQRATLHRYEDDRPNEVRLIEAALRDMAQIVSRVGVPSVLAGYRGRLSGEIVR